MLAAPLAVGEHELFARLKDVPHVAIAVSGGSDSTALMCLVGDWARAQEVRPKISVLTVDHGLRAESAEEAVTVAKWAKSLEFPHRTLVWEGPKPVTSLQARARQARYDLMTGWCRSNGAGLLLTGHTMDDQAETVAMRMERTATDASLAGIWRSREWNGIVLHRPLLDLRRETLRGYLATRQQAWIDDPSNEQERFERVRVRRSLAAATEIEVRRLAELAAAAAEKSAENNAQAKDFSRLQVLWHAAGFATVEREAFGNLPPAVQKRVVALLLEAFADSAAAPDKLSSIADWAVKGGPRRRSLGGVLFGLRRSELLAGREPGRIPCGNSEVPASGRLLWDHRIWVESSPGTLVRAAGLKDRSLAPDLPMPRFVRDGWPAAVDRQGSAIPATAAFKPCLR